MHHRWRQWTTEEPYFYLWVAGFVMLLTSISVYIANMLSF